MTCAAITLGSILFRGRRRLPLSQNQSPANIRGACVHAWRHHAHGAVCASTRKQCSRADIRRQSPEQDAVERRQPADEPPVVSGHGSHHSRGRNGLPAARDREYSFDHRIHSCRPSYRNTTHLSTPPTACSCTRSRGRPFVRGRNV